MGGTNYFMFKTLKNDILIILFFQKLEVQKYYKFLSRFQLKMYLPNEDGLCRKAERSKSGDVDGKKAHSIP